LPSRFAGMTKHQDTKPIPPSKKPPEGPHAKPELIDPAKTPGSGMVPKPGTKESEAPTG
jgi:hypothetical protein